MAVFLPLCLLALFIGCVIDPAFADKVNGEITDFGDSISKGPIQAVVGGWTEVAVIGGVLGVIFLVVTSKVEKHEGHSPTFGAIAAPAVPTAPTFGGGGGFEASSKGGVGIKQHVTAGS